MSLERPVNIACPKCKAEQEVIIWESLNVQVTPEAKEELFKGNINVFRCRSCGFEAHIPVDFMYHDMALKFVVQYFPFVFVEEDEERVFASYRPDGTMKIPLSFMEDDDAEGTRIQEASYMFKPHIVFDMEELVRYVIYREKLACRAG